MLSKQDSECNPMKERNKEREGEEVGSQGKRRVKKVWQLSMDSRLNFRMFTLDNINYINHSRSTMLWGT